MTVEDINSARPRYLQWTLFRDYHYAVFDTDGKMVYVLVTDKPSLKAYWTDHYDKLTQNIVYENHEFQARIMAGRYIVDSKDLVELLEANHPAGKYDLSVVNASGDRLYNFAIYI